MFAFGIGCWFFVFEFVVVGLVVVDLWILCLVLLCYIGCAFGCLICCSDLCFIIVWLFVVLTMLLVWRCTCFVLFAFGLRVRLIRLFAFDGVLDGFCYYYFMVVLVLCFAFSYVCLVRLIGVWLVLFVCVDCLCWLVRFVYFRLDCYWLAGVCYIMVCALMLIWLFI